MPQESSNFARMKTRRCRINVIDPATTLLREYTRLSMTRDCGNYCDWRQLEARSESEVGRLWAYLVRTLIEFEAQDAKLARRSRPSVTVSLPLATETYFLSSFTRNLV